MAKNKLAKFAEMKILTNVFQPTHEEVFRTDYKLKGKWGEQVFGNHHPIVLEVGCGKGEYSVGLGELYPEKNFIGLDIKGARMWTGAKAALEKGMQNVIFLRTHAEVLESIFAPGEISEIWITFPDPQLRKGRVKKRLTAPEFLTRYARFLRPGGPIHLKSDCRHLHDYTRTVAEGNALPIEACNTDIYGTGFADDLLSIKTTYEKRFLAQGVPITYIRFSLDGHTEFAPVEFAPDELLQR